MCDNRYGYEEGITALWFRGGRMFFDNSEAMTIKTIFKLSEVETRKLYEAMKNYYEDQ
jgi:hypothetical protein